AMGDRPSRTHPTAQGSARGLDIASDLRAELLRTRETQLVTQALHERGLDPVAVHVALPVQQVRLERSVAAAERRPYAEARRGRDLFVADAHGHRVDAVARQQPLARYSEVDGRKAERSPAFRSVDHRASHAVRAAQKPCRTLDVTRQQRVADAR